LYRGTESFRAAKGIRAVRLAANPVWILPLHRVSPLCGNPWRFFVARQDFVPARDCV